MAKQRTKKQSGTLNSERVGVVALADARGKDLGREHPGIDEDFRKGYTLPQLAQI